jgi:O-antigen ligase
MCALILLGGCFATVSRTGIVMLLVIAIVFFWLRPREMKRLWPALLPALVAIHFVLPGTLGALKESFLPKGGIVAEQRSMPGQSGSGRLADVGPALQKWRHQPLLGEGYGTYVVDPDAGALQSNILDDQWLGTLLEVGVLGAAGWVWFFIRIIRKLGREAKRDDSERGWLLASLAAGIAAFSFGMFTFDAFSFIQVTFLLYIYVGLGASLLAERPIPLAARERARAAETVA